MTWTNGYGGVWHFPNGVSLSSPTLDSTTNGNKANFVNVPTATAGLIDGAVNEVAASSQAFIVGDPSSMHFGAGSVTLSVWTHTSAGFWYPLITYDGATNIMALVVGFPTAHKGGFRDVSSGANHNTGGTITVDDGAWHYIVGVRDAPNNLDRLYVDGIADGTNPSAGANTTAYGWGLGGYYANGGGGWADAIQDESRMSTVVRTA